MNVETVETASLSNDPANLRLHSDAQIEKLVGMLRRWGQTLPLLVDSNSVVRVGNARLEAAQAYVLVGDRKRAVSLLGAEGRRHLVRACLEKQHIHMAVNCLPNTSSHEKLTMAVEIGLASSLNPEFTAVEQEIITLLS